MPGKTLTEAEARLLALGALAGTVESCPGDDFDKEMALALAKEIGKDMDRDLIKAAKEEKSARKDLDKT